jgi:MFS family permease
LSIIAVGLSLAEVGGFNITLVSVSPKIGGISMGITVLLFLIGMSIGPAIAGILLETFQSPIMLNEISYFFPSKFSYDMIFFTAALISFVFLILSIVTAKMLCLQR